LLISQPICHSAHQDVVIDPVEEFLQIKVNHPPVTVGNIGLRPGHCPMRRALRSESKTGFRECGFEDGSQYLRQRLLNEAIEHDGNTQLALPASRLVDFHASNRLRLVLAY